MYQSICGLVWDLPLVKPVGRKDGDLDYAPTVMTKIKIRHFFQYR